MNKKSHFLLVALLLSVSVILSSSMPVGKSTVSEATTATTTTEPTAVEPAPSSTVNAEKKTTLSYKEMKTIATQLKGSKLTFKEKVGLKLFGKRIANKFAARSLHAGTKSQLVALLLCLFLGDLGIHRFYLGYTWQGIVQLLTLGGCGIWALIDFIRICTGSLQPKDSDYDVTL